MPKKKASKAKEVVHYPIHSDRVRQFKIKEFTNDASL